MIGFSPDSAALDEDILLREVNHRVKSGLVSAINLVSAAAVRVEGAEAKHALSDVVELLHGYTDVHRALAMPEGKALIDASVYLRRLCWALRGALLDRLNIQLTFKGDSLPLQTERCGRLGLIVNELVTNAMEHACFDGRTGEIKIKLARTEVLVNCVVTDNGTASTCGRQGQGLRIISALSRSLGGRIEYGVGTDFRSVVLSFLLTESERKASCSIASRCERASRRLSATSDVSALCAGGNSLNQGSPAFATGPGPSPVHRAELVSPCRAPDVLGELLSPSHGMDGR